MSDQPLTLAVFEEFQRRLFDSIDARFDRNDARFDSVDARFGVVAFRFDALDRRFDGFEKKVDSRFDEVAGQIDGLSHRLLHLDDEYVFVKEALKGLEAGAERMRLQVERLESGQGDLIAAVHGLDERLSRVEKRLDDLVASEPRYASREEVESLKAR